MPATDFHASSAPFAALGRQILSMRRDQVHAMDGIHDSSSSSSSSSSATDLELESFQRQVAGRFFDLAAASPDDLLSLSWIRHLLESFLCSLEDFRSIVSGHRTALSRSPLDRLISDFFDRSVKALDLCNAIRDGVDQIRQWQKQLEIVICALDSGDGNRRPLGEGQFRRAKKALTDLAILMLDQKDAGGSSAAVAHRNRSFGRTTTGKDSQHHHRAGGGHFRSLSWSVSRSWSAARQLQAIGNNLVPPKNNEIVASGGVALAVFTMSTVLHFLMWALVAAIPCQDRGGLHTHLSIPRQFVWAVPVFSLHERILEESKKRERKNSSGLLREIHQIERCARHMMELTDAAQFPLTEERLVEVRQGVQELRQVCSSLNEGLGPLERLVRDAFHRIVRSRTEGLDCLGKANYPE